MPTSSVARRVQVLARCQRVQPVGVGLHHSLPGFEVFSRAVRPAHVVPVYVRKLRLNPVRVPTRFVEAGRDRSPEAVQNVGADSQERLVHVALGEWTIFRALLRENEPRVSGKKTKLFLHLQRLVQQFDDMFTRSRCAAPPIDMLGD